MLAITAALAVTAVSIGAVATPAPAAKHTKGKLTGKARFGRLLTKPRRPSRREILERRRELKEVNHSPPTPVEGPVRAPYRRPVPDPTAFAAASTDFELFSNTIVSPGATDSNSQVAEPTVANDRNAVLYTANWHAAVSGDNGTTWNALDPDAEFDTGVFCCDQVAHAAPRDNYSMIFWLLQANGGFDKLLVYQGRDELLAQDDYCEYDLHTEDAGFDPSWKFDFNQMSSTSKFLYISMNVFKGEKSKDSVVWRFELSDLDREPCANADFTTFKGGDTGFSPALVEGATTTMYWASHHSNSKIDIWKLPDSASEPTKERVNISNFKNTNQGDAHCRADGTNPCGRLDDRIHAGWIAKGFVGWMWSVGEGKGFDFPHTRVARFRTSDLDLVDEPDIWNPDFAWIDPSVGVNEKGDVGITLYRIGGDGGVAPRARVALVDDVSSDWDSLTFHAIVDSTNGTDENKWGDYGAVHAYDGCPNTWLGSVWSMQGGRSDSNAEHRFTWFGRERDACPDLAVPAVLTFNVSVETGDQISVLEATKNVGSEAAPASKTRFFLSHNDDKSSDDLPIGGDISVPALNPLQQDQQVGVGTVPAGASGSYYVLACADNDTQFDEISEANCTPAAATVSVTRTGGYAMEEIDNPRGIEQGRNKAVFANVNQPDPDPPTDPGPAPTLDWYIDVNDLFDQRTQQVGSTELPQLGRAGARSAQNGTRRRRVRTVLKIPRRTRAGRYRLFACLEPRGRRALSAGRCLAARRYLYVLPRRGRK